MSNVNNSNHFNQSVYMLTPEEIRRVRQLLDLISKPPVRKDKVMASNKKQKHDRMKLLSRLVCQSHSIAEQDFFSYCRKRYLVMARADFSKIAYNHIGAKKRQIGLFLGRTKLGSHSSIINLLFKPESHVYKDLVLVYKNTPLYERIIQDNAH